MTDILEVKALWDSIRKTIEDDEERKRQAVQRKHDRRYYGKLYRLCKKYDITWTREDSYWDFSKPIGTVGLNEDVDDYESAYEYVVTKIDDIKWENFQAMLDDSNFDRETV